ncbi:THAP domain-containing protein 2-like [Hydra vulgaris]|uniref:THAP domain-containing protein 2-like n=1 Tax=Hydra vulgaris TaxID=6087 RepID=A0ABM4D1Q1_HYDVU
MVNSCAAAGCTNRAMKNDNRAFHKFPINNRELCKRWIVAIKRETFIPTEHSRICSDHFLPSDYSIPDFNNKPKLKPFSVPSFIIDSKSKVKKKFSSISPQKNKKRLIKKVSETGSHHHINFHSDISDNNNVAANSNEIYINSVILKTTESIDCQVDIDSSFNIIESSNKIINDDTIISKSTLSTNASPTKAKLKAKIKILKQKL